MDGFGGNEGDLVEDENWEGDSVDFESEIVIVEVDVGMMVGEIDGEIA